MVYAFDWRKTQTKQELYAVLFIISINQWIGNMHAWLGID